PLGRGRIEPLEARHELRRAGEARGVERLLELAGEPAQLVGVRQSLRFDLERLRLPALRRGPRDLVSYVPQVVGLATDLFMPGAGTGLAPRHLAPTIVRIAHGGSFHGRVGVGVDE